MTSAFKRRVFKYLFRKILSAELFLSLLKTTVVLQQKALELIKNREEKTCRFLASETDVPA